jgi:acid stress chaperone HdeB
VKIISALLVSTALFVATPPASAQKLDLSTIKCKDFVSSSKENIGLILMWLTGFFADEDDPPVVDFDKMKTDAEKIGAYCGANPEIGLITAAEEIMAK